MNASKEQLARAAAEYMAELAGNIPNIPTKILLGTAAATVKGNPAALNTILESPAVKMLLPETGGEYCFTAFADALRQSIERYGNLQLTLPAIPLITKAEQTLAFTPADVERLREIVERQVSA